MDENIFEHFVRGMISGTSYFEGAHTAITKTAEAIGEFIANSYDAFANVFSAVSESMRYKNAYACAEKAHPQWVRFAKHHKKKRIRKKYHDRIMREFGGNSR